MSSFSKSSNIRTIALERIQRLFEQAQKISKTQPELSAHYVELAKKIAMAAKIHLPVKYRRQACKNCNSLFIQGINCRVRVKQKREPHVVITCLNCGYETRVLLRKKKGVVHVE